MWNLKNKTNEQAILKQAIGTEWPPAGRGVWGRGEIGEGIKRHKLVVTKQTRKQRKHREYSQ